MSNSTSIIFAAAIIASLVAISLCQTANNPQVNSQVQNLANLGQGGINAATSQANGGSNSQANAQNGSSVGGSTNNSSQPGPSGPSPAPAPSSPSSPAPSSPPSPAPSSPSSGPKNSIITTTNTYIKSQPTTNTQSIASSNLIGSILNRVGL